MTNLKSKLPRSARRRRRQKKKKKKKKYLRQKQYHIHQSP